MESAVESLIDRRRAPRAEVLVPIRPAGQTSSEEWRTTRDISATGLRMLSDRAYPKGDRLDLELLLPDGSWLPLSAKVAWSVTLDVGSVARYEVGIRFLEVDPPTLDRLAPLLPTST